jgi:hypothetical protein
LQNEPPAGARGEERQQRQFTDEFPLCEEEQYGIMAVEDIKAIWVVVQVREINMPPSFFETPRVVP